MKFNIKCNLRKVFSVVLVVLMLFTTLSYNVNRIKAEEEPKNKNACERCQLVKSGGAPSYKDYSSYQTGTSELNDNIPGITYGDDGYSSESIDYVQAIPGSTAVYRGGNAISGLQDPKTNFDSDPNDFVNVLPYGNTYIDTSKIKWNNGDFEIDIKNSNFLWIAGSDNSSIQDKNGNSPKTDPLGDGIGLESSTKAIIAYVGNIKGYLGNNEEDWRKDSQSTPKQGQENIFEADDGDYLYRITYPGAAILKDGTRGNLIIETTRVEIETTATQEKAVITLQTANQIDVGANLKDGNNNYINVQDFVAMTKSDVENAVSKSSAWTYGSREKKTRAATGAIIDFTIKVTDSNNNPIDGNISYAARDVDLDSYQSLWGRSIEGEDKYKFNESLTIVDGALSYAVTPYYDHANGDSRFNGWVPVRPGANYEYNAPLHITKNGGDNAANGVRFSGTGTIMMRDSSGSFKNAIFDQWGNINTVLGKQSHYADTDYKNINANIIPDVIKQQLQGKIKDEHNNVVAWDEMTNEQIFNYVGEGSFGSRRGDNDTYDTGFAVILDASDSKFRWSGSMQNGGSLSTTIFDSTTYTYVEQTHGTGGGIYLETYDLEDNCNPVLSEGTVTMGRNEESVTVTAVPEEGYRVNKIIIGNGAYDKKQSLQEKTIYVIDGNNIKIGNSVVGTFDDSVKVTNFDDLKTGIVRVDGFYYDSDGNKQTSGHIIFKRNSDGTVDVTLPKVDNPMHVHVDFGTDYYIYKVWKNTDTEEITDITFNATPYSYSSDSELIVNSNLQAQQFKIKKDDANNENEKNIQSTNVGDNVVWEIKYPSEGYKTQSGELWPALTIESEPSEHNKKHIDRIYWFAKETAPTGFVVESYDNSAINDVPGQVDVKYKDTNWYKESVKYANRFKEVLNRTGDKAFMSIFKGYESGAKITNIPQTASISIFKKWDDEDNADGLRKELVDAVELLGKTDSEEYGQVGTGIKKGTVPTEDDLIITWINVPIYRKGKQITYKVTENVAGLTGYTTDPGDLKYEFVLTHNQNKESTFTNKRTPDVSKITITKQWDDNEDEYSKRPDKVTVQLIKTYLEKNDNKIEVDKKVTVNGSEYTVKKTADNIDYFVIENKYYRDDDIEKENAKTTDYEELIPFNPDDTGEVVKNNKIHVYDEVEYQVLVTSDSKEYYIKDDKYYDLDNNELDPNEESFNPSENDEAATEEMTIEVDGENYEVKSGKLAGEEQWYYEKDDKYYDISNKELIKFVPSEKDETVKITVPGEITYGPEKTETEDVILTAKDNWTKTIDVQINTPVQQKIVYGVTENNAPAAYMMSSVTSTEDGVFVVTNKILPPIAEPSETIDYKGKQQTGTPKIEADTRTTGPDGSENKIERITLLDENGKEVNTVTVPGEGTYTLNENGTITFTPEPEFVGETSGVRVKGYDSNGLSAETTYTPTVIVKVSYVDPLLPDDKKVVQGPTDSSVPGAKDITTTYEDTPGGKSKNHPGYRFDGWEETIDPNDPSHYIRTAKYTPMHNINYDPNGGTGYMPDNDYPVDEPNKPHDSNTFTREGYTFVGFKAYITDPTTGEERPILDNDGKPIIFRDSNDMNIYFKDMPAGTSIRMEAQWKIREDNKPRPYSLPKTGIE